MGAEKWCVIDAFPVYAVSSLGRVKRVVPDPRGRLRGPYLKGIVTSRGYVQVGLWRDGVQHSCPVHRLVCTAFHGPAPTPKHAAAHRDGDSLNNAEDNLRWATALENAHDKKLHGTEARGERQGAAKLSTADVIAIRNDSRPQRKIAADYNVTQANISSIVCRKSWGHIA